MYTTVTQVYSIIGSIRTLQMFINWHRWHLWLALPNHQEEPEIQCKSSQHCLRRPTLRAYSEFNSVCAINHHHQLALALQFKLYSWFCFYFIEIFEFVVFGAWRHASLDRALPLSQTLAHLWTALPQKRGILYGQPLNWDATTVHILLSAAKSAKTKFLVTVG
jgi:hypothetical protein